MKNAHSSLLPSPLLGKNCEKLNKKYEIIMPNKIHSIFFSHAYLYRDRLCGPYNTRLMLCRLKRSYLSENNIALEGKPRRNCINKIIIR